MLQNDITFCKSAGYTNATVEIFEVPLLTSLRLVERTKISSINEATISSITSDYNNLTYHGLSYDDSGNIIFTFVVND